MSNEEREEFYERLEHRLDVLECDVKDLYESRERILSVVNEILGEYGNK